MFNSNVFSRFLAIVLPALFLGIAACSPLSTPVPSDTAAPTQLSPPAIQPTEAVPAATLKPADTPVPSPTAQTVTTFPDPAGFGWSELITNLNRPVGLVSAHDSSGRLFVIEQRGRILIFANGNLLDSPFLDIRGRVGSNGSEQGLLGLAFHPDYEDNGYFFVNYTNNFGNTVISRFEVSADPDIAESSTENKVLEFNQPFKNHNGGQILFGPEGYLWIASGDGGSGGDPQGNAQNLDNLLGKLLRIDVNQGQSAIPEGNPFGNEIWAYGLRNPWRFTFDPANGDLYIADVGQSTREEIHYLPASSPAGANFGWNYLEGSLPFQGSPPAGLVLTDPVWEYAHPTGCSISGGAVYRGSLLEWQGIYLYGDFCTGQIWGLLQTSAGEWSNQDLFQYSGRIAAIDQDESGEIYLVDLEGSILKLTQK
jgi:glucose/arabinose dehydrogenase